MKVTIDTDDVPMMRALAEAACEAYDAAPPDGG